ncbi:hypothetical protein, partial [Escherichia coli]|uniref:hypothetical protein n=1 Tax=Escherichia coli TaxID=562 RepID=UPI003F506F9D
PVRYLGIKESIPHLLVEPDASLPSLAKKRLDYMGEEGWLEGVESSVTVFRNDVKDRISISRTSDVNAAPGYQNFV